MAAEPRVFPSVFAAAEFQASAPVFEVAEPQVFPFVFEAAEFQVVALVFVVSELQVVFVSEPQASADIPFVFVVLVPVSVFVVEVDSPGRPKFFAFPNIDYCPSFSSYCEVARKESVHGPNGVRANYGLCSIPSSPDLHQNRNLEQTCNNPNPRYNYMSDTNALPIDATTNHSRKKCLRLYQEQRIRRTYQAPLSPPVARQIRWAAADQY